MDENRVRARYANYSTPDRTRGYTCGEISSRPHPRLRYHGGYHPSLTYPSVIVRALPRLLRLPDDDSRSRDVMHQFTARWPPEIIRMRNHRFLPLAKSSKLIKPVNQRSTVTRKICSTLDYR